MLKKIIVGALLPLIIVGCGNEKVSNKEIKVMFGEQNKIEKTGIYSGEVDKNGIPNGTGLFKSANSQGLEWTYEGEFSAGVPNGKGVTNFANGYKQEGTYKAGNLNGKGKETQNGKTTYEGDYKDGVRNGQGKLYNVNTGNVVYEGTFLNGAPNGAGKLYNDDSTVRHEGNFLYGFLSAPPIGLNQKTVAVEWEYSVSEIKTFKTIGNQQAGGTFVMVYVDTKNNGNFARNMGNDFFILIDEKGRSFNFADLSWEYLKSTRYQGAVPYTDVNPGISVNHVAFFFDVPEDCKELYLIPSKINPTTNAIKIK